MHGSLQNNHIFSFEKSVKYLKDKKKLSLPMVYALNESILYYFVV